jgi:hypothetical protein
MRWWGITGFVVVAAVADAACEGLFSLVYGCRLLNVPTGKYVVELAGSAARMLVPSAALTLLVAWRPAEGWFDIVSYGAGFTLLSGLVYLYVIEGTKGLDLLRARMRPTALPEPASAAAASAVAAR